MKDGSLQPSTGKGFTLIELLVVVGIIGILASIVIVAVNPRKQIQDAYDAERLVEANAVLNAVYQFQVKEWRMPHQGTAPAVTSAPTEVCGKLEADNCVLESKAYLGELIELDYLSEIPVDPENDDVYGTGYEIWQTADGRVHVRSLLNNDIEVSL